MPDDRDRPVTEDDALRSEARVIAAVGEAFRGLGACFFLLAAPSVLIVGFRGITGSLDRLDWYVAAAALGLVLAGLWCLIAGGEVRRGRGPY